MAAELGAAQSDLSVSLAELRSALKVDTVVIGQGEQQLAFIRALAGQLATSKPDQIPALSAQIASAVSSAAATARLAQRTTDASNGLNTQVLATQAAAHKAVNEFEDAYFKQRKFNPYLKFASEEDEREYRRREAERQRQIEEANAQGTPGATKKAIDLSIEQMRDAGDHGANRSPDFAPLYEKLADSKAALDAQIETPKPKVALNQPSSPDPLDDLPPAAPIPAELLAKFRATGAVVADQTGSGHGVTIDAAKPDRAVRQAL